MAKSNLNYLKGSYLKPKRPSVGAKAMREELGRLICKYRLEAGVEQAELSEACGYNYRVALHWEDGAKPHVSKKDAESIIKALGLPENAFEKYEKVLVDTMYRKERDAAVGKNMAKRLEELGISHSEFGRMIDLYPQHIYGFANGTTEPKVFYIKRMAELLFPADMQMEGLRYLFSGTPLPRTPYQKQLEVAMNRIKFLEQRIDELKAGKPEVVVDNEQ